MSGSAFTTTGHEWLVEEYEAAVAVVGDESVEVVHGNDVLPSRLAVTDLAVGAVAAAGGAALRLLRTRAGRDSVVTVDGRRVSASFRSDRHFRLDGAAMEAFAPLSGFWRTHDGWVRTHANYPHHRLRLLGALGLSEDTTAAQFAAVLAERDALEVEQKLVEARAVGVAVRSPEQWAAHPQARALAELPLVGSRRLDDSPPRSIADVPPHTNQPAVGLHVLDLTRVIAGPVATRTLALLGADVLRVDSPRLREIPWQHLDSGMGKRSTLLDLRTEQATLEELLNEAHVLVLGYRPDALTRYGLAPEDVAARHPGLVVATLSAWGNAGPWGQRRGFDSIVQAATGIAVIEGNESTPGALPAQALDHATGYLLTAAILDAVGGQQSNGGSRHVQAHLARTAAALLKHHDPTPRQLPDVNDILRERPTPAGALVYAPPALHVAGTPDDWITVGSQWGVDPPGWIPDTSSV
jgi:crotonobetainyl-CoA:carnitine CoA-transferase CaiB-like acyl-CoA transferase